MVRRAQVVLGLAALVGFALASSSAGQGPPGGSPPGLDKAKEVKEKHADKLLDKPGVAGIGVGLKPNGKPVIRIYKEKADVADVPESLEDIPVESVTTGILEPRAPTDRFPRPVPIGVSSGHFEFATGTLGARVTDGTNVYALSNNHVYAGANMASIGDPILQPGPIEDNGTDPADRIGTLFQYAPINFEGGDNVIDAAIALTSSADVGTATPPDGYGSPSTTPTAASPGQAVQKYGRTTGLQLGTVADISLSVDVCYFPIGEFCLQEARFIDQFSVTPGPFSASGDSGSLIVTQGANQPVGLLFAGGDGLTIGNPINAVLQAFDVTIEGGPPTSGPPTAPQNLRATAGDDLVELTWNAPAFDGGSPVSHYRVFRGTSPGGETFLAASTATTYTDPTAQNGTTYHYKVSAVNANGEGPLSTAATVTPIAAVAPTPLPAPLDDFNRPDENPLSDAGRWSNDIFGGGAESGHHVTANELACSRTTTCTAWRNNAQYGPDAEVWARLTTLPGLNNALRLYVRLQPPSTAGYMLRTNQLSGPDEVLVERIGVPALRLLTIQQELAAGDLILLRAKGQSIEVWRQPSGGAWSRLGVAQDAMHGDAGNVGIGLRGTTGRIDDFGARTLGAPPPDTTPPSAPGTLSASAVSSTRIDLSWGPATDTVGVTLYRIERCQGPSCANFTEIATVDAPATSYQNTGLDPSTSYSYRVRAEDAALNRGGYSNEASATTQGAPQPIYFSLEDNGTVGGISVANEDVVSFDGASTFSLAFDGSDVGLSSRRLDAFTWLDSDTLLFSLDNDGASLAGAGTVDDSDVVRFDATSLGSTTTGTFSMYFDGSDVGLTTNAEDVDAFELLTNGNLILSTDGSVGVTGVSGADEDLLAFTPSTLGATTSGTFALYLDGSDVGLTASGEDVDAVAVDAAGRIHLSTRNDFAVTGVTGADEDVFVFTPSTLGTNTTGTFSSSLYFDGSAFGLAGNNVFAIDLPVGA